MNQLSEYLTIDYMARLAVVNKKYHDINENDIYWEKQFKTNWKNDYLGLSYSYIHVFNIYSWRW